ncbi:MAG: fibronectin type III domain-containing protein [Eubacteriales bacterium]|nr:fibronectin type III domain-containing protein [Eubacteriales bacterium]
MKNNFHKKALAALLVSAAVLTVPTVASANRVVRPKATQDTAVASPVTLTVQREREAGDSSLSTYLKWTPITLADNQSLCIEYSEDPNFPDTRKTNYYYVDADDAKEGKKEIYTSAGKARYYRTVVLTNGVYSAYSAPVSYTAEVDDAYISNKNVTKNSVEFRLYGNVDGFEISKKVGNKYKVMATTNDNVFTEKGLQSGKTYSYRVRGYVYDEYTKQKIFGDKYDYTDVTTWGSALNVKAVALNKKSIKLTWKKVKGASGYRIYRAAGYSNGESKKEVSTAFSNYKLIKTFNKAGAHSFKDKKLDAGVTYNYKVVAFSVDKKDKKAAELSVEDTASATTDFDAFANYKKYTNEDGSVTCTWDKTLGIEGYIVERYGKKADGSWGYIEVDRPAAGITTYTFAPYDSKDTNWDNDYCLYAYKGDKYERKYISTSETQKVATTTGITAVAAADGSGIDVSWAPVAGAAYYRVYRSTRISELDLDENTYDREGNTVYTLKKEGTLSADGKYYTVDPTYTYDIQGTTVKDTYQGYSETYSDDSTYEYVRQEGPKAGVRYYYYVQAFARNGEAIPTGQTEQDVIGNDYYFNNSNKYSKPASAMITATTVGKAKIKSVASTGKGKVKVTLKAVSGAEKYYVYCSTKKGGNYEFCGVTTKKNVTVTGLESGKTYYFKVKAVKANEAGADATGTLSKAAKVKVK